MLGSRKPWTSQIFHGTKNRVCNVTYSYIVKWPLKALFEPMSVHAPAAYSEHVGQLSVHTSPCNR